MTLVWADLPHEEWCKFGRTHAECCPPDEYDQCSCLTSEVVEALDKFYGKDIPGV